MLEAVRPDLEYCCERSVNISMLRSPQWLCQHAGVLYVYHVTHSTAAGIPAQWLTPTYTAMSLTKTNICILENERANLTAQSSRAWWETWSHSWSSHQTWCKKVCVGVCASIFEKIDHSGSLKQAAADYNESESRECWLKIKHSPSKSYS